MVTDTVSMGTIATTVFLMVLAMTVILIMVIHLETLLSEDSYSVITASLQVILSRNARSCTGFHLVTGCTEAKRWQPLLLRNRKEFLGWMKSPLTAKIQS